MLLTGICCAAIPDGCCHPATFTASDNYLKLQSYNTSRRWCVPRQLWPTRQRGGGAVRRSADGLFNLSHGHTGLLAATHSYAMSPECLHLISKYWLANRRPETVTYGHKKIRGRTRTDSGRSRGFGCRFGLRNTSKKENVIVKLSRKTSLSLVKFNLYCKFSTFLMPGLLNDFVRIIICN